MKINKKVPEFNSLDELVEFFDTNDMGEYLDNQPEVEFDVDISKKVHLVPIDNDIAGKVSELAKSKKVSSKDLINTWLKEKLLAQK